MIRLERDRAEAVGLVTGCCDRETCSAVLTVEVMRRGLVLYIILTVETQGRMNDL